MLFKDLKNGNTIYLLDRNDVKVSRGTVTSVSLPHYNTQADNAMGFGMVVDVSISSEGNSGQYVLSDNKETAYANSGSLLITPNLENVLSEIRAIKVQSENFLNSVSKYQDNVKNCDKLLTELDPVFKKEQVNERRFSELEKAIGRLSDSNAKITEILNKITTKDETGRNH